MTADREGKAANYRVHPRLDPELSWKQIPEWKGLVLNSVSGEERLSKSGLATYPMTHSGCVLKAGFIYQRVSGQGNVCCSHLL